MNAPARVIDMEADSGEIDVSMDQLGVSAAEVNQQIATAKRYPRSLQRFRQTLLSQVTLSEPIAQSCLYALPRGGKKIEGPSIRFAEIAMGCWGNCRATARIVAETDNFIVAQGIFIDLERNVAVGIEVNRRIVDSKGKRYDLDMIGVTGAAASSIALRNAILRGIPRALFEEGYIAAKRTVAGTLATLQDRRNRMLEAFAPYNVTQQQILDVLGKQGLVEVGLEELVTLGGYLTAIQQEQSDPEDLFPPATKAADRQSAPAPRQAAPAAPKTETKSPSGGGSAGADAPKADGANGGERDAPPAEQSQGDDGGAYTALESSVADALIDCSTLRDVEAVEAMFAADVAAAAPAERARIKQQFAEVRAAISNRGGGGDFPGDRK